MIIFELKVLPTESPPKSSTNIYLFDLLCFGDRWRWTVDPPAAETYHRRGGEGAAGVENCRTSLPLPQMSTLLGPAWWPSTKAIGLFTERGTFWWTTCVAFLFLDVFRRLNQLSLSCSLCPSSGLFAWIEAWWLAGRVDILDIVRPLTSTVSFLIKKDLVHCSFNQSKPQL